MRATKYILAILVSSGLCIPIRAQNNAKLPEYNNKIFSNPEVSPTFPGGVDSLKAYIDAKLQYPVVAEYEGIEGRPIISFVVEKDGSITDVKVHKSAYPSLDKEALRIIKEMPRWNPGYMNGKATRCNYLLPIDFKVKRSQGEALPRISSKVNDDDPEDKVYDVVEQMPSFQGGIQAMMKYISDNLRYPPTCGCAQGRVIINFVVEKDGAVSNAKVLRSVDPSLDKEALRLVNNMPKWIPGKQDGRLVRVRYNIPIAFRLQ